MNYKKFCAVNGYSMELYAKKVIFKQLKNKCIISHDYNKRFDLIVHFQRKHYNIEIKSAKKFSEYKRNGKIFIKNGQFKLGYKQINDNKIDVFIFITYYRKAKSILFVSGKSLRNYFKNKNKVIHYSISEKQIKQFLKPKENIKKVLFS